MVTRPKTIPDDLTSEWSDVEEADRKRQLVRDRIDEVGERIADARRRLSAATAKGRDDVAAELAALRAEASVLPDEYEDAADGYAVALHHFSTAVVEMAKEIEAEGNRKAKQARDDAHTDAAKLSAFEDSTPEERRAGRVHYLDAKGERCRLDDELPPKTSAAMLPVRASAVAESATKEAKKQATPLLRLAFDVTKVDDRATSIFPAKSPHSLARLGEQPLGSLDADGRLRGHEAWLQGQRAMAVQALERAR